MKTEKDISIFLVDDDKIFTHSMEHHLQHKLAPEVKIETFSTGEECLKNLNKHPDIIVLDHFLNSSRSDAIDGAEVLRKIKLAEPETTAIMLSGLGKIEIAVNSMKNGAFAYVIKNDKVFLKITSTIKSVIEKITNEKYEKSTRIMLGIFALSIILGIAVLATKWI